MGDADANLDGQFNNGQNDVFLSKFSSDGPSNKPPISISISTNSFNENISAGSLIATMQGTDPDINETFTYALVGGEGSSDNKSFTVDDNQLKIKESPNHEIKDSYSIRLRTTDSDGLTFEKAFTLTVRDVNEAPTNIYTTTTEIDSYIPNSSVVATLSSADQDVGDTHTYDLVTGSGDADNGSFVIDGNELKIKSIQDQETKDSYSIRLRTTDSGGLNFEKSFAIAVEDRSVLSINFDGDAAIGQSIALPISLDGANGLQAFELVLAYDSDIFSIPTSSPTYSAPDLTSDWSFLLNTNIPGQIKIAGFGVKSLTANSGALINLNLNVNDGIDPTTTTLDLVSASLNEDAIDVSLQDLDLQITPPSFQVLGARQLASGLALKLYEAPDLDALNLYDGNDTSIDQPDLLLTRTDGQTVDDLSIHWQADSKELFLLQTDSLTGAALTPNTSDRLDPGDYKLTIASRADGLIAAASGDWLDGDQDGTPGGDYSYSFSKTTSDHLISIGDTTRGPGQKLGLNGHDTRANITGLPVLISTETAIKQLQGTISYDAGALTQISLIEGRQLPSSWSLTYQDDGNGTITYSASGNSALRGTDQEIFRLAATVDADASYGSSTLIQATAASTDDPSLSFDNDPSLIVLAYSGDATGNGSLSSLDASLAARVVVDLDSGFDAFDDYAPMLLGDTTGNGNLSSLDSSHILRRVVGLETDSFPEIPG